MQLFYNSATEAAPVLIDGVPPVDQSAEVASLNAQVNQLTTDLATRTAERDARQTAIEGIRTRAQARKDADAAKVDGQDDLDALSGF